MEPNRSLIVTADADLLDELLRLTSQAGVTPVVVPDAIAAEGLWVDAPLVVVGADQAMGCARAGLRPRSRLVLVSTMPPGDPLWELADELGVENVAILPEAEPWLVERFELASKPHSHTKVIGVLGARGGAGASVLATALAVTATRQKQRVLLIDADPLGGGIDLLLGWEDLTGLRWPELADGETGSLPTRGNLSVLSQGRNEPVEVVANLMDTMLVTSRVDRDLVIVDLPRRFDEGARRVLRDIDWLLLVVPAELRACAAASKVITQTKESRASTSLIVRDPSPGRLRAQEIARALDLPLSGTLRTEPGLASALERGTAPAHTGKGPLSELCVTLLGDSRLSLRRQA